MNEIEKAISEIIGTNYGECQCHREMIVQAVEALREKTEREKGCEYCENGRKQLISLMCHGGRKPKYYNPIPRHSFCPMCGKRLEVGHE